MKVLVAIVLMGLSLQASAGMPKNCIKKCSFGDGFWYTVSCLTKATHGTKITVHNCELSEDERSETCTTDRIIYNETRGPLPQAIEQFKRYCQENGLILQ